MPVLRVAGAVLLMVDAGCGMGLALLRSAAVVVIRNVDSMDCKRICICFIWNFSVWAVSSSEESEEELEEEEEYMRQEQQQSVDFFNDRGSKALFPFNQVLPQAAF